MRKVIWKYVLGRRSGQVIEMPESARLLACQMQRNDICVWAEIDDPSYGDPAKVVMKDVAFYIEGTGNGFALEGQAKYFATVQDGPFVWHIYVKGC